MASFNSDGVTNTTGNVKTMMQKESFIFLSDRFTTDGASETTSDTVTFLSIPAGYRCIAASIDTDGLGFGTSCTCDLGVAGDTAGLFNDLNINAAGCFSNDAGGGIRESATAQPVLLTWTGVGAVPAANLNIDIHLICAKLQD